VSEWKRDKLRQKQEREREKIYSAIDICCSCAAEERNEKKYKKNIV